MIEPAGEADDVVAVEPSASRNPGNRRGSAVDGPAIVDAVVAADEMPNMPHVDFGQIGHFAIAKIKEAVLAVTGG